jgi:hypothetical protein
MGGSSCLISFHCETGLSSLTIAADEFKSSVAQRSALLGLGMRGEKVGTHFMSLLRLHFFVSHQPTCQTPRKQTIQLQWMRPAMATFPRPCSCTRLMETSSSISQTVYTTMTQTARRAVATTTLSTAQHSWTPFMSARHVRGVGCPARACVAFHDALENVQKISSLLPLPRKNA